MWLLRQRGIGLREIGAFFGGLDYAAVSQRIRRLEQEIKRMEVYARNVKC
jgi:hypothetical protein